jgi:hypothetical protein
MREGSHVGREWNWEFLYSQSRFESKQDFPMPDPAGQSVLFPVMYSKPVVVESDDQPMSTDGGAILLIPITRALQLTESLAAAMVLQAFQATAAAGREFAGAEGDAAGAAAPARGAGGRSCLINFRSVDPPPQSFCRNKSG